VLGDDAQLRHVAALTGRAPDRVAAAADALAASDILRPVDAGALRFAHPLLASAVYADVGTGERAALHRRAAEILRDENIAPERVAAHLLPSSGSGESWVVAVLADAASRALTLGAPESAASYLRRALEEPPPLSARAGLLRQLGVSEAASGLPSAVARLEDALAAAADERDRAQTLLVLGRTLAALGRHGEALRAFDEAAASAAAEPHVAAQARAEAGALGALDSERRPALLAAADELVAASAPGTTSPAQRALLATGCLHQTMRGTPRDEVLELARRALAGDAPLADQGPGGTVLYAISVALHASDELAWNDRLLTAAMAHSRGQGSMLAFATASLCRGVSRWSQGRLTEALADADQAADAVRYGWRQFLPSACGARIGLLIDRGELQAASAAAQRHDPSGYAGMVLAPWHEALGRLALVERREGEALEHFEAWRDVTTAIVNPACSAAWRSASSYALASLGRIEEATALAAEELEHARAFGAPRAISVALRALGHAEAHGDLERPIALLEEAVRTVAGSEARLEHCRALLDLGTVLRRAGRRSDAGRALGEALELARACGARLIEERALEELEVAGTRVQRAARRGADALSPSERRVVGLAIDGLSNRQIAEALFVTRKAVEWHLGNAYRKLDVRSRRELPAALGGAPDRRV
jgi:DNA-binding CsgD family transcriptional regulator